ncbi:MAG: hypothetical protein ACRELF_15340 [Gemmataceae bacterium]
MKTFTYNGESLGEDPKLFLEPRCYIAASHSSSSQSTSQKTLTTSGATSPISGGAGSAASSGSIAVGQGGKYQESGSLDLSGSNVGGVGGSIKASSGATVNIGDENAVQQLSDLANTFAQTVQGVASGSGGGTVVLPATTPATSALAEIPWTTLGLIGAAIAAIIVLGEIFGGKSK